MFICGFLDRHFPAPRLGRRQENAVGMVPQTFIAAEDADKSIGIVVVRFHVVIRNRPVVPKTIHTLVLEVVWPEAQGDATPVIRAPSHHARTPPAKAGSGGNTVDLAHPAHPTRQCIHHALSKRDALDLLRPRRGVSHGWTRAQAPESFVLSHIPPFASEQDHVGPGSSSNLVRGHAAAGTGANDADIIDDATCMIRHR